MKAPPPVIFDRKLRHARRARWQARGQEDFIHQAAAGEIIERLGLVKRAFSDALIVGAETPILRAIFSAALPSTKLTFAQTDDWTDIAPQTTDGTIPPAHQFDLVISLLDLHAANDMVGTLILMCHVLRADGLLLAALFGAETLAELRECLVLAETDRLDGAGAHIFPFADVRDMGGVLQRAGFALPVADEDTLRVSYPDLRALMNDIRRMGESNVLLLRPRRGFRRDVLARAENIYAHRFAEGDRLQASFSLIYLSGWAPSATQPKPLRPGSAAQRLASALHTHEHILPDKTKPPRG